MVLDIEVNTDSVKKLEKFLGTGKYKDLVTNTKSFSRKINEERKMRLPYVCGQTGVAQKHYNTSKRASERMPGARLGQVYSYPQKKWQKKNYQYLAHFMLPKHLRYAAEERAALALQEHPVVTEESNSNSQDKWGDFYMNDDEYAMADPGSEPESDSDFEYEGRGAKRGKGRKSAMKIKPSRSSRSSRRMEDEAMSPVPDRSQRASRRTMPDSPGPSTPSRPPGMMPNPVMGMPRQMPGHPGHPGMMPGAPPGHPGHPGLPGHPGHPGHPGMMQGPPPGAPGHNGHYPPHHYQPILPAPPKQPTPPAPKRIAEPSDYCDFCLGGKDNNKKTGTAEELIGCSECGRSGHPTCLQFTANMLISVKKYPWQCIECKTCTLCGTSENDDKLLFCDDCDRGYHMYCLVPPMKVAPEGSWSCSICIERFHK